MRWIVRDRPQGRWQRVRRRREALDQVRDQRVLLDPELQLSQPTTREQRHHHKGETPEAMALRGVAGVTLISVRDR